MAKLHSADHPASVQLVGALEEALVGCLTASADAAKPNAQAVSSIWWVLVGWTGCSSSRCRMGLCHWQVLASGAGVVPPGHRSAFGTFVLSGCTACRYSWGRIASDGYSPSQLTMQLMWDRTQALALAFDSQGIANMLW